MLGIAMSNVDPNLVVRGARGISSVMTPGLRGACPQAKPFR